MNINAITSPGSLDRFPIYSSDILDNSVGRISSGFGLDSPNSALAARNRNVRSFTDELELAIERIKFENEKLLIRDRGSSAPDERIKNVDEAEQAIQFASYKILSQSGTGMLTQANLLPESALQLLQT